MISTAEALETALAPAAEAPRAKEKATIAKRGAHVAPKKGKASKKGAAEVDLRDYRCSACGSTKRGEGMRLVDRKPVPCSSASPEYIARHRASGIFTQEASA